MANDKNGTAVVSAAAAMQAQMMMAGLELEKKFPGCGIILFVTEARAADVKTPEFNHVATIPMKGIEKVLHAFLDEQAAKEPLEPK